MQSRPYNGANKSQPIGLLRKVLFGAACLISFICVCCLISFKSSTQNAMNGELITDAQSSNVVASTDNSVFTMIFDYFGLWGNLLNLWLKNNLCYEYRNLSL